MELKPGCKISVIGPITRIEFTYPPNLDDWKLGLDVTAEKYLSNLRMWVLHKGMSLSADDLVKGAKHARSLFPSRSKLALVSSTDLGFGLSRVYEAYREESSTHVQVFRLEDEAESWLLEDHLKEI